MLTQQNIRYHISKYRFLFWLFCFGLLHSNAFAHNKQDSIHTRNRAVYSDRNKQSIKSLIDEKKWNRLFPHRNNNRGGNMYSYQSFLRATGYFPDFLSSHNSTVCKRELAAFLANIAQETSGGWDQAPDGYFSWGLYYTEELADSTRSTYTDYTKKRYPPAAGKSYHGRGPKQLSWNYNYGQFSEAWYGSKDTLLLYPERVCLDPTLSFASAIWFWMTAQYPKPSCHEIMTQQWTPTENDTHHGRVPGFGATVNIINGGIECGQGKDSDKTRHRYEYYLYFCRYFNVSPGPNISCSDQQPFGI